ncbi:methylase [beta proteobacterium AAP99]|nr:methylase [beta proteobacterium AAP99]
MPALSWTEIRDRATTFARRWKDTTREQAESQSFWTEFLNVFGVDRKRVAEFEKKVQLKRGKQLSNGRIDLFWPGKLLVEMKSAGKDLDRAFDQATDYFEALADRDLPRFVLVSDFARFRLWDLERNSDPIEFTLDKLPQQIKRFGFIAGYEVQEIRPQDPVNLKAAERMGKLHDALKAGGYDGHALEVLLVRLLFCLFADDTGIFQPAGSFREWIENDTKVDGSDLGRALAEFFDVLNTDIPRRQKAQREQFEAFPYINGQLFAETLRPAAFDAKTRELLLDACALDWSTISPAIFGALFQSIMDAKARRNLGAHYTSEENILKLIKPLFLDELWAEFERVKHNRNRLLEFHKRLRTLNFFDPACGCGNFLVITYRELRKLELDVLRTAYASGQQMLDVHSFINIDVDQFHGIEIEEFPAQIAQVALWLTDHQMNRAISEEFGAYYARIPLKAQPHIVHGNALRIDWEDVLPAAQCAYVLGNPPFVGYSNQNRAQKADVEPIFGPLKGAGVLDYVAAWYIKATHYLKTPSPAAQGRSGVGFAATAQTRCAFVSTNSITQGEQVGVLWGWLLAQGIHIHFAHRTFKWSNEASGKAAVHCVIVGFGLQDLPGKVIYEYDDIAGEPHAVAAVNINPYLIDAADLLITPRTHPICDVPAIKYGSKPVDDGNLLMTQEEMEALVAANPSADEFVRQFISNNEYLYGIPRWCLWLVGAAPSKLKAAPKVLERVLAVRRFRLGSTKAQTRALATTPGLFAEIRQPAANYLVVLLHTSENRGYVPFGYATADQIVGNSCSAVEGASVGLFGVVSSKMHMAWMGAVCGRLESRFRYSNTGVYNNFPWPSAALPSATDAASQKLRAAIESAAQGVLDARAAHPGASLADLYDPLTMPPDLVRAHQKLDAAVDAAYVPDGGKKTWKNDAERVAFLFTRYQQLTSLLPADKPAKPRTTRKPKAHKDSAAD